MSILNLSQYFRFRLIGVFVLLIIAGLSLHYSVLSYATPGTQLAAVAASTTYNIPSSIDATGATDVTQALLDFIATVPDGTEGKPNIISFATNGKYRIEGTLQITNRNNLTFEGNGALLFATTEGDRVRGHMRFVGGSHISVHDISIKGANPNAGISEEAYQATKEGQHGFDFKGVAGVELDNVKVSDIYGDFVYLGLHRSPTTWTSDVHITNSRFERSGRHGVAIVGARDVLIENNYFDQIRYSSTDIEPLGEEGGAERIMIKDNRYGPARLIFFTAANGYPGLVKDITVQNNTLEGIRMQVVVSSPAGTRRSGFHIIGNTSNVALTTTKSLMSFRDVDGVEVKGNTQPITARMNTTAIIVERSCQVEIGPNNFSGALQEFSIVPWIGCVEDEENRASSTPVVPEEEEPVESAPVQSGGGSSSGGSGNYPQENNNNGNSDGSHIVSSGGGGSAISNNSINTFETLKTPSENNHTPIVTNRSPSFVSYQSLGARSSEVARLQTFLISRGHLTPGNATGYFGPLTQSALQAFQRINNIVSSGTPATTGYGAFGPQTRARVNTLLNGGSINPVIPITLDKSKEALIQSIKDKIAELTKIMIEMLEQMKAERTE